MKIGDAPMGGLSKVWVYRFETDVKYLFIQDFIFENVLHAI